MTSNRRNKTRLLVSLAAALAALVCSTDLLVEHRTEGRIAARAAQRLDPHGPVHADLTTPLAGLRTLDGDVGDVEVTVRGVRRQHAVMDVTLRLRGVTTDGDSAGGSGTATIGYDQVTRRLGSTGDGLTARGRDGDLVLDGSVGRLGLPVAVRCEVSTTADSFTVTPTTVNVLGRQVAVDDLAALPSASALRRQLEPRTVPVTGLPRGVRLTSAHATADGLVLAFSIAAGPTPGTGTGAV
ncbi:LmeA family phospholipid-binding protein [Streptomyces sp. SID486]|uniref:LmeA family phospholipid-binding protein n=1 Tax=Streptomyces sp. SID486 TaxID=2690264 RepID=UPI00136F7C78|nr:LmeA family phospholipid-binding protein [Streptomyces sp. SID486]